MKEIVVKAWCVSVFQLKKLGHSIMERRIKRQFWMASPTETRNHVEHVIFGRLKTRLRRAASQDRKRGSAREIYWLTGSMTKYGIGA